MSVLGALANVATNYNPDRRFMQSAGALSSVLQGRLKKERMKDFGSDLLNVLQDPENEMSGSQIVGLIQKHQLEPQEAEYAINLMKTSTAWDMALKERKRQERLRGLKAGDVLSPTGVKPEATAEEIGAFPKEMFKEREDKEEKLYDTEEGGLLPARQAIGKNLRQKPEKPEKPRYDRITVYGPNGEVEYRSVPEGQTIKLPPGWTDQKPEKGLGGKKQNQISKEMTDIASALKEVTNDNTFDLATNFDQLGDKDRETVIQKIQGYATSATIPEVKQAAQKYIELGKERGWWTQEKANENPGPGVNESTKDFIDRMLNQTAPNGGPMVRQKITR